MSNMEYVPGLENVIASETSISYLDVEKEQIVVRGYDLLELAERATYADTAYLLLHGRFPNAPEREELESKWLAQSELPQQVEAVFALLPHGMDGMDVLRTGISALAGFDAELEDHSKEANVRKAIRLIAKMPQLLACGCRTFSSTSEHEASSELSFSGRFLRLLTGRTPSRLEERLFDQSLILYSEHEMPNSTFAARVIASTMSDLYGAVAGGASSLKGKLHGGANEAVMHMLLEAGTPEGLTTLIKNQLDRKQKIMGFGHRVYMRKPDPRALLMKEALLSLCLEKKDQSLYELCVAGEEAMEREKGLYPNLDYYAAPVYHLLGIPIPLFTPVFLAARTAGICAHVIEQHEHNRLFRPRVLYKGPRGLQPPSGTAGEEE
ncbi:citrate synthase [Paenibacillus sp. GCM10027627]|uniref:citrate synthase n=1 Tax=unclassified Paenibacillus TaxID=185978 RepID=UPI0036456AE0